jgi:hypothetical protein
LPRNSFINASASRAWITTFVANCIKAIGHWTTPQTARHKSRASAHTDSIAVSPILLPNIRAIKHCLRLISCNLL